VHRFSDIAGWTAGDVVRISQTLGFAGRIEQENWVGQAQILAKGGDAQAKPRVMQPANDTAAPVARGAPQIPGADRLHRIIGLDAVTEQLLVGQGITRFADIARWTWTDIEKVEAVLGQPGRVGLENWIGQAKILAQGGGGNVAPLKPAEDKPAAPATPSAAAQPTPTQRADFAGLRSVRSEALRGEPSRAAPVIGQLEDLKRIRGVGVLIEKKLNSLGVTSYEQIANWTGHRPDQPDPRFQGPDRARELGRAGAHPRLRRVYGVLAPRRQGRGRDKPQPRLSGGSASRRISVPARHDQAGRLFYRASSGVMRRTDVRRLSRSGPSLGTLRNCSP
jgi:predicted flap endonuclease-1-like 5' DNA nuclease